MAKKNHNEYFRFYNRGECEAFRQGVEYVNDSSIEIVGIYWIPGPKGKEHVEDEYCVHLIDNDRETGGRKPARWSKRLSFELVEAGA